MRVRFAAVVLLLPVALLANGGPIDVEATLGGGNPAPMQTPSVRLLSEELNITVSDDLVDITAVYRLRNDGGPLQVLYGFPLDRLPGWYGERPQAEVRILEGAAPLDLDTLSVPDSLPHPEGYMAPGEVVWYTTELFFDAGQTRTITAHCRFRPFFEDFATTKSFFPSWSTRSFRYRLDPAGAWGEGSADSLSLCLDISGLLESGATLYSLLVPGHPVSAGVYRLDARDYSMASAPAVTVSWSVREGRMDRMIAQRSLRWWELEDLSVSSTLPDQGDFTYAAENLLDGDPATAWAESASGSGEGQRIELDLPPGFRLGCLAMLNGYHKDGRALRNNARADSIVCTLMLPEDANWAGGREVSFGVDLPDSVEAAAVNGVPDCMEIIWDTGEPREVDAISLEIIEAHAGATYSDLCVSELLIMGLRKGERTW